MRSTDTMASILDSGEQAVAHSLADLALVEAEELRVYVEVMLAEIGRWLGRWGRVPSRQRREGSAGKRSVCCVPQMPLSMWTSQSRWRNCGSCSVRCTAFCTAEAGTPAACRTQQLLAPGGRTPTWRGGRAPRRDDAGGSRRFPDRRARPRSRRGRRQSSSSRAVTASQPPSRSVHDVVGHGVA